MKRVPKKPKVPEYPKVEEVFGQPYLGSFSHAKEPDCFNGIVSVRKYRITVEEIPEPVEVIRDRIRMLWRRVSNTHHWDPLREAAKDVGIELDWNERGTDRTKRSEFGR